MDQEKTGGLIRTLRQSRRMTQLELARQLGVSDKAVSKWERGLGCPDVSLLPALWEVVGVDVGALLEGDLPTQRPVNGNLRLTRFYVCPHCGGLMLGQGEAAPICCGPLKSTRAARFSTVSAILLSSSRPFRRRRPVCLKSSA